MQDAVTYDSKTIIDLAWIALLALVTIAISVTIIGVVAFRRSPDGKSTAFTFSQLFERARALQMTAVILIVVATAFLALFRVIDSSGVVGILSGIAGYVLGSLQKESSVPKKEESSVQKKELNPPAG